MLVCWSWVPLIKDKTVYFFICRMLSDVLIVCAQTSYLAILKCSNHSAAICSYGLREDTGGEFYLHHSSVDSAAREILLLVCVAISYFTFLSHSSPQTRTFRASSQITKELSNSERFIAFCSGFPNVGLLGRCWETNHSFLANWSRSSKTVKRESGALFYISGTDIT